LQQALQASRCGDGETDSDENEEEEEDEDDDDEDEEEEQNQAGECCGWQERGCSSQKFFAANHLKAASCS
jgi:hypothetical protein